MRRPGLFDVQVNGYRGHDVDAADVTPDDVVALTRALWSVGTSRYLPTAIPGIHVEGPHSSDAPGASAAPAAFLDVDTSADHLVLDGWDVVEVAVDGEVVHRA